MKQGYYRWVWLVIASIGCYTSLLAQEQGLRIKERGAHHRVVENVVETTDATGQPTTVTNTYTELEIGLHYQDAKGEWVEATDELEIINGKAIGNKALHQVAFEPNIATPGAITLVTPEGQILRSHVLGLSYFDPTTGQSVLIAEVKDSIGEVHGRNQVIYHDAFDDVAADIRYTFTKAGFEQDVILRAAPPAPEKFGLNPQTVQLQVLTEFLQPPVPEREDKVIDVGTNGVPTMNDVALNFGAMQTGRGRAFTADEDVTDGSLPSQRETGVPVGKEWGKLEGRDFLIESVSYPSVQAEVEALPANPKEEASLRAIKTRKVVLNTRELPIRQATTGLGGSIRAVQASVTKRPGLVVDYSLVSTVANHTFKGDTTYYVDGNFTLSGTTVIEGGAVIKYSDNSKITVEDELRCETAPYRMAVFTSKDDNTVGEGISGSDGNPTGNYAAVALSITENPTDLHHVRFLYCQRAVEYGTGSVGPHYLRHAQIINCTEGIRPNISLFYVRNVLMQDVTTCFVNTSTTEGRIEHLTVAQKLTGNSTLIGSGSTLSLNVTNSLLAGLTSTTGFTKDSSTVTPSSSSGIFTDVGAGTAYLSTDAYRNQATSLVDARLQHDLQQKTTYAPTTIAGVTFNTPTVLNESVARDTDVLDLGYHYDPIDYAINSVVIANTTVTLTNGVALAVYGDYGFLLRSGAKLVSEGHPTNYNRIVRYQSVQERSYAWGPNATSTDSLIAVDGYPTVQPQLHFRFTELNVISMPGNGKSIIRDSTYTINPVVFTHCHLQGGKISFYPYSDLSRNTLAALTNNILERTAFEVYHRDTSYNVQTTLYLYNNLFYGGTNTYRNNWTGSDPWIIRDNLFDNTGFNLASPGLVTSYNGYVNCGPISGTTSNNVSVSSFVYFKGPLGRFYHQGANFSNAGSRNGASASLYHHTNQKTQGHEGSSTVDLGFHYPAVTMDNLALGKSATQASDYPGGNNYAGRGTDGSRTGNYAHTASPENKAWWQVDLGALKEIEAVWIWNRADTFSNRLSNFYIFITDDLNDFSSNDPNTIKNISDVKSYFNPQAAGSPGTYEVRTSGRYLRIQQTHASNPLNIHELEAYASFLIKDTDGDGLPDVTEDRDGDNTVDSGETNWNYADSDYDGVNDYEELLEATSPLDANSVRPRALASWSFNSDAIGSTVIGDQGQAPLTTALLEVDHLTWDGYAVKMPAGSPNNAKLGYRENEPNGTLNINLKKGSVSFWFKPDWSTSPSGPNTDARLISVGEKTGSIGYWGLSFNTAGNTLSFQSSSGNPSSTLLTKSGLAWVGGEWHQLVLTYDASASKLYIDGQLATTGSAVSSLPGVSTRALGLWVGSSSDGVAIAKGSFDVIQTYNYALDAESIQRDYEKSANRDDDEDGLGNLEERLLDLDPNDPDTDNDLLPDGWEVKYDTAGDFDPLDNNTDNDGLNDADDDADDDGFSNLEEYLFGSNPLDDSDLPHGATTFSYYFVGDKSALVNIKFGGSAYGIGFAGVDESDNWGGFPPTPPWNIVYDASGNDSGLSLESSLSPIIYSIEPINQDDEECSPCSIIEAAGECCWPITDPNWPEEVERYRCHVGWFRAAWSIEKEGLLFDATGEVEIPVDYYNNPTLESLMSTYAYNSLSLPENVFKTVTGTCSIRTEDGTQAQSTLIIGGLNTNLYYRMYTYLGGSFFPSVDYMQTKPDENGQIIWRGDVNAKLSGIQIVKMLPLDKPIIDTVKSKASKTTKSVILQWDRVGRADEYEIYRSNPLSLNFELISKTPQPWFEDGAVAWGATYKYQVVAQNSLHRSEPSDSFTITMPSSGVGDMAPILNYVRTMGQAFRDTLFTISARDIRFHANAIDPEGQPLTFKIERVLSGTLKLNGVELDNESLAEGAFILGDIDILEWVPPLHAVGEEIAAFEIRASDGTHFSRGMAIVNINVRAPSSLMWWGWNMDGVSGSGKLLRGESLQGTQPDDGWRSDPSPVVSDPLDYTPLTNMTAIAHSGWTGAALKGDGTVWTWGFGSEGQLADGKLFGPKSSPWLTTYRAYAAPVDNLDNVKRISVGERHSLVALADGTVWGWGKGDEWQLGQAQLEYIQPFMIANEPVLIPGIEDVVDIAAGSFASLALRSDGRIYLWGQWYTGDYVSRFAEFVPKIQLAEAPAETPRFVQIVAGYNHFMALSEAGEVYTWGNNHQKQLGYVTSIDSGGYFSLYPKKVPDLTDVKVISAGKNHSIAVRADGSVYQWGTFNSPNSIKPIPTLVLGIEDVVNVSTSGEHVIAVTSEDKVYAWGSNNQGQLGQIPKDGRDPANDPYYKVPTLISGLEYTESIFATAVMGSYAITTLNDFRPRGLTAAGGDNLVDLRWRSFPNAIIYHIYRSESDAVGTSFHWIGAVTPVQGSVQTYRDRTAQNGRAYLYAVEVEAPGSETGRSDFVSGKPLPKPEVPSAFSATGVQQQIHLSWHPVDSADAYEIYRATSTTATPITPFTLLRKVSFSDLMLGGVLDGSSIPSPILYYIDPFLDLGTTYNYKIRGVNEANVGDFTIVNDAAAQTVNSMRAAPSAPSLSSGSLTWGPPSDVPATGPANAMKGVLYYVKMSEDNGATYRLFGSTLLTSMALPVTSLRPWVNYKFKVSAVDFRGESPDSTPCALAASVDLTIQPELSVAIDGTAYIKWNSDAISYNINITSLSPAPDCTTITGTTENEYWLTNLQNGVSYTIRVSPVWPAAAPIDLDFVVTPTASGMTLPTLPTITTTPGNNRVKVTWYDETKINDFSGWRFILQRSLAGLTCPEWLDVGVGLGGWTYTDNEVVNSTAYIYRLVAISPLYQVVQAITSSVTPAPSYNTGTAPGAMGLTVSPGNSLNYISWVPVQDNASQYAYDYELSYSTSASGPFEVVSMERYESGDTLYEYVHGGLENGKTYYYQVRATFITDDEVNSPVVSGTPSADAVVAAPRGLTVVKADGKVVLTWNPVPGSTFYTVERKLSSEADNQYVKRGQTQAERFEDVVINTATYVYRVKAWSLVEGGSATVSIFYDASIAALNPPTIGVAIPGGENVSINLVGYSTGSPTVINTPTNLVLRATVEMENNSRWPKRVDFYANSALIGSDDEAPYEITWSKVPGTETGKDYTLKARLTDSDGRAKDSAAKYIKVTLRTELGPFRTAATDFAMPAPGLGVEISRSYDSRDSSYSPSTLGSKGWRTGWDKAKMVVPNLAADWKATFNSTGFNRYNFTEDSSHQIELTLPDGMAISFYPHFDTSAGNPLEGEYWDEEDGGICYLTFPAVNGGQGELYLANLGEFSASGDAVFEAEKNAKIIFQNPGNNWIWDGPVTPYHGGSPLNPQAMVYETPEGTQYLFVPVSGSFRLKAIRDQHLNTVTYKYNSSATKLTEIRHSNGRKLTLSDGSGTHAGYYCVFSPEGGVVKPVIRYKLESDLLTEVHRLVGIDSSETYEITKYVYESGTARLTRVINHEGVVLLENTFTDDWKLSSQKDASGAVTSVAYSVDSNTGDMAITTTQTTSAGTFVQKATQNPYGEITKIEDEASKATEFIYDEKGRKVGERDATGKLKTFAYDEFDRLVQATDGEGNATKVDDYNNFGQPASVTDANGNTSGFVYDSKGALLTSVDAGNATTTYEYNERGQVTKETRRVPGASDPLVTEYFYETDGDLAKVQEPSWSSGSLHTTEYTYDNNGNRKTETHYRTPYAWSGGEEVGGTITQSLVTQYAYDSQNRLTNSYSPLYNASVPELEHSEVKYDVNGRQKESIDAYARPTKSVYDVRGNLIEVQYPNGDVQRTSYDARGRVEFQQERATPYGSDLKYSTAPATKMEYDAVGRVQFVKRYSSVTLTKSPDNGYLSSGTTVTQYTMTSSGGTLESTTRTQYDAAGRVEYSVDALGHLTKQVYDDAGRRVATRQYYEDDFSLDTPTITVTDESYHETTYGYDGNGNQIWVKDALNRQTDYEYDEMNRLLVTRFPLVTGDLRRKERRTHYDGLGQRLLEIDEAGVVTAFGYDDQGRLTSVTNGFKKVYASGESEVVTRFVYDELGNQIRQIDARGSITSYYYDKLGRRIQRRLPTKPDHPELVETIAYSAPAVPSTSFYAMRKTITDFSGHVTKVDYDLMDRLVSKDADDTAFASQLNITFTYKPTGQRAMMTDSSGVTTYIYDSLNRLNQKGTPQGVLAYTYDDNNNVTGISGPNTTLIYEYDRLNRLHKVKDGQAGNAETVYTYDAVGNLDTVTYPNTVKHDYDYTEQNRLTKVSITKGASPTLASFDYNSNTGADRRLGPTGVRRGVVESIGASSPVNRTVDYTYDRLYRLTKETLNGSINYTYAYDQVGNRVVHARPGTGDMGATYDARDRMSGVSFGSTPATPPVYGPNGNVSLAINGNVDLDSTVDYQTSGGNPIPDTYDFENRLAGAKRVGKDITIVYDGDGHRVRKTVNGVTTYYLVDELNPTGYAQVLEERTSASPPTSGLLGHWPMEGLNGANQIPDSSGNGRHGSRAAATDQQFLGGVAGLALDLPGTGYVSVPNDAGLQLNQVTLAAWVLKRNEPGGWVRLIGKGADTVRNYGLWDHDSSPKLRFQILKNDGSQNNLFTTTELTTNAWYHVACTWNGTTAKIYLNGVEENTATWSFTPMTSTDALTIGRGLSSAYNVWPGMLDEVRVYNRALSAAEVGQLMSGTLVKRYVYGLDLVSQTRKDGSSWVTDYYGYDGLGSVRFLTDESGDITDTYNYDAFGVRLSSAGTVPNNYLFAGEQWDDDLKLYYNRARYYNPHVGVFWSMDTFEGTQSDPLSLHKYLYTHNNPVNGIDPSGKSMESVASMAIQFSVATMNLAGRVYPAAQFAAMRIGYWYLQNQGRILMAQSVLAMGGAATVFLNAASEALLKNAEQVHIQGGSPGAWVENKVGANATHYQIIDDFRDGNATSIKTSQRDMMRTLRALEKEANTLADHNSPWKPSNNAPSSVRPIPISQTQTRTLIMVIPENHSNFLTNPTFVNTIDRVHRATGVILRVVPLRFWRK